jgi:hypothetical protein
LVMAGGEDASRQKRPKLVSGSKKKRISEVEMTRKATEGSDGAQSVVVRQAKT